MWDWGPELEALHLQAVADSATASPEGRRRLRATLAAASEAHAREHEPPRTFFDVAFAYLQQSSDQLPAICVELKSRTTRRRRPVRRHTAPDEG